MATILDTIVATKRKEVKKLRLQGGCFGRRTSPRRPFADSVTRAGEISVVAEVKKASPSKGVLCRDFDPVRIANAYQRGGARAISVLTDEQYFQGSLDYLVQVRAAVTLPVLRKEFIIDPVQVQQTAHFNADALLLIAAILSDEQLGELHAAAAEADVETLIEVHNHHELDRVLALGLRLVGINNRDLNTFETTIETTLDLLASIPAGVTVVSESGIAKGVQTTLLCKAGVSAVLVGESLVTLADPGELIAELSHACSH